MANDDVPSTTSAIVAPDRSQRVAARFVGAAYLFTNATAFFEVFYVSAQLIDHNDGSKTAALVLAHETLFRLGIASDLLTFSGLAVLITALYVVLRPVNSRLAILAVCWRLIEIGVMVLSTAGSLLVLRFLKEHGPATLEPNLAQALSLVAIGTQSDIGLVGYLFLGLGSCAFNWLWLRSGYVPTWLAVWGLLASAICAAASLLFIVFPHAAGLVWYAPIGTFELVMGVWLSARELRVPQSGSAGSLHTG